MGHLCFYAAAIAACLLWSATFTAAAARTNRDWLRRLLVAAAILVPVIAIVPWLAFTAWLAFGPRPLETNWFAPTLTAFVSALVGSIWIVRAGLARPTFAALPVAAGWPLVGLAAMFLLAKAVSLATLLTIDNAVAAQAAYLRLEAANIVQSILPVITDADNAAPLYMQAFAALDADTLLKAEDSPLSSQSAKPSANKAADLVSPAVADLLARHATTLDAIRRAAEQPGCQFVRDWARPSLGMLLPELQDIRLAARLLALAARSEAAAGDTAAAVRDVIRLHRMGQHAASEPILISALVGIEIDAIALDTLVQILPRLTKADLPLLKSAEFRDAISTAPNLTRILYGEEAFGMSAFADIADSQLNAFDLAPAFGQEGARLAFPLLLPIFRTFFLPADIAGYRGIMRRYQNVAADRRPYAELKQKLDSIEGDSRGRGQGMLSSMLLPLLNAVYRKTAETQARHAAAAVLVAATKQRLESGSLPSSLDALVPTLLPTVPRDPFAADTPLALKQSGEDWSVYSVGPDGEDDGGPVPAGAEKPQGNDDVGLRMGF